ncbi:hypothetical protein ACFQY8_00995 [Alloscardovia venturai]|uniref:Teichoic acid transporter n=1 Tax=Alloscardovia venturai TaxID=1769421 RepID=A0ABW2Y6Y8_9BIFI
MIVTLGKQHKVLVDEVIATSTDKRISIADAQRAKKTKPWVIALVTLLGILVVTVPYGLGRNTALRYTGWTIWFLSHAQPQGWALVSWSVTVVAMLAFALAIIETAWSTWGIVAYVAFGVEQYLSGLALFKPNYWWGAKVIFGSSDIYANGISAGIMCSAIALGVFAAIYFVTLIFIKKSSPLNVLTRSWAAFILFFIVEIGALVVAMFGGLI